MIEFETMSGAVYTVDPEAKKICRRGKAYWDGARASEEWKPYEEISGPTIGRSVVILWTSATPLLEESPEGALPMTETSPVVRVEEVG